VATPRRKEIDLADFPGKGIDRASAPNPNASQLSIGRCRRGTQHILDASQRLSITAFRIRRTFRAG
jgi:hypothetical protein